MATHDTTTAGTPSTATVGADADFGHFIRGSGGVILGIGFVATRSTTTATNGLTATSMSTWGLVDDYGANGRVGDGHRSAFAETGEWGEGNGRCRLEARIIAFRLSLESDWLDVVENAALLRNVRRQTSA